MRDGMMTTWFLSNSASGTRGRRGSVLILVMTLLSILFVMGVAFLATMNFEAESLLAESRQRQSTGGVDTVVEDSGRLLQEVLMADPRIPFGEGDPAFHLSGPAELPGWHNLSSPVEPRTTPDGRVVWGWFDDLEGLTRTPKICVGGVNSGDACEWGPNCPGGSCEEGPEARVCVGGSNDGLGCATDADCNPPDGSCQPVRFAGPAWRNVEIDSTWPNGSVQVFYHCVGGTNDGASCRTNMDCQSDDCQPVRMACTAGDRVGEVCAVDRDCPGGICGERGVVVVDADGDGIVDTVQVEADLLGFTEEQIAQLSSTVNAPSNATGRVYVGLRVVPHGGMVNLNDAHPRMIEKVLGIPNLFDPPDLDEGGVNYRPIQEQVFYSPLQEEAALRRRGFLPPRVVPPSLLHGNGLASEAERRRDPYGGGDMPQQLFPPRERDFEQVFTGEHRFWPVRLDETLSPRDLDGPLLWPMRMEPFYSAANDQNYPDEYDQRHLLTTVSHDDLLSRGGRVLMTTAYDDVGPRIESVDIREAMMRVNAGTRRDCATALPFEYADYPHDIANATVPNDEGTECDCPTRGSEVCRFDRRKGRLKLSLPWLDAAIGTGPRDQIIEPEQRNRLIQEAFFMLLNNAAGDYWKDVPCTACSATEGCGTSVGGDPVCVDAVTLEPRRLAKIARTAASLTANMIDYMDDRVCEGGDRHGYSCGTGGNGCPSGTCGEVDTPTRIAIRSFDFKGQRVCMGGSNNGDPCITDKHADFGCPGGHCETIGESFDQNLGDTNYGKNRPVQYVYGLEKQPYITEVVSYSNGSAVRGRAVELFNPYEEIDTTGKYVIVEADANGVVQNQIPLTERLGPGEFTAFYFEDSPEFSANLPPPGEGRLVSLSSTTQLKFENQWVIYLVRNENYIEPGSTTPVMVSIVVDQMKLSEVNIGLPDAVNCPSINPGDPFFASMERSAAAMSVNPAAYWKAALPTNRDNCEASLVAANVTLGRSNQFDLLAAQPIEIRFANTGSFTRTIDDPLLPRSSPRAREVAFPTTGSMLFLMRHANRALTDWAPQATDLAFTTWLDDQTPGPAGITIEEYQQIDNGRMPVFDLGTAGTGGPFTAHHVHPRGSRVGRPGGVENLPWGQLVFDYFTALPLSNLGPYRGDLDNVAPPDSQPRVDLGGLRVHGRIDLNAAPWTVLEGLPYVPMEKISIEYRPKVRRALGLVEGVTDQLNADPSDYLEPDDIDTPLKLEFAQAIVAYREAREIAYPGINPRTTGDYGSLTSGLGTRAWRPPAGVDAAFRRGTGFLTVGELANVRHPEAAQVLTPEPFPVTNFGNYSYFRSDKGFSDTTVPGFKDYVSAVSVLAALGDWVTVRSHVFTVYGVVRGEPDEAMTALANEDEDALARRREEDVDARALRFQETVDRLPTFLGERLPARVGERVLARYKDTVSD